MSNFFLRKEQCHPICRLATFDQSPSLFFFFPPEEHRGHSRLMMFFWVSDISVMKGWLWKTGLRSEYPAVMRSEGAKEGKKKKKKTEATVWVHPMVWDFWSRGVTRVGNEHGHVWIYTNQFIPTAEPQHKLLDEEGRDKNVKTGRTSLDRSLPFQVKSDYTAESLHFRVRE